jgi:phenylpropionate dioxygenase-like ring-hydroxylating dioxygenase large terminal subunit
MSVEEASWSAEDQAAGYTLPARFFYDAGVFQREKTHIFFKSWHLVGHVNELREPGTFLTHEIFEQSIIVVAGRDGKLRAFHNVCQHRGNRLVDARRGKVSMLTCAYHAWTYSLDGCLRGAAHTQNIPGFDKNAHGLKPVQVAVHAAFIYINLDPQARSIDEMAPGAEAEIRRHIPDLDRLTLLQEVDVPVAANWKVIQENSIEGYHFDQSGPAHKQLVKLIDFAGYTLTPRGEWWTYTGPPNADTTEAYGLPLEGATWQTSGFFNFGLWPNATLYVFPYADVVGTFVMMPTGPETSMLRFGYYAVEGRPMPEVTKACIRWMNEDLGPEDIKLNVSNQKGLRSFGFERGRYVIGDGFDNRSEHLVQHFHKLCYDAISS